MKRFLFILVFLVLHVQLFATTFEVDGLFYQTTSKYAKTVTVTYGNWSTEPAGTVTVPATVMYNETEYTVVGVGAYAFSKCLGVTNVELPHTVTTIGMYAFDSCANLQSVSIPASVTSIRCNSFSECASLTSFVVADDNEYYCGDRAILYNKDKTSLKAWPSAQGSVEIPNMVEVIDSLAFAGCEALTKVVIPNSVQTIGYYAFINCWNLEVVEMSEHVSAIGEAAFMACVELEAIDIPEGVTTIEPLTFNFCQSLTSVEIPSTVTSIEKGAFLYCDSLETVTLSDNLTYIGAYAFEECSMIKELTIPATVDTIGTGAFIDCISLETITCMGTTPPVIDESTADCFFDYDITLHIPNVSAESYSNDIVWGKFTNVENDIIVPTAIDNLTNNYTIRVVGRQIQVETTEPFVLYDINGRRCNNTYLQPGIYVVKIGERVEKVAVR